MEEIWVKSERITLSGVLVGTPRKHNQKDLRVSTSISVWDCVSRIEPIDGHSGYSSLAEEAGRAKRIYSSRHREGEIERELWIKSCRQNT